MTDQDLHERILESADAFDGLLSLIPATVYYGEDTSDQWRRKKQSKAEKKAALLARLDPDSEKNRTAKDVMEEKARNKRKLQELEDDAAEDERDDDSVSLQLDGIEMEQPLKRQKIAEAEDEDDVDENGDDGQQAGEASATKTSEEAPNLSAKQQKKLLKQQAKLAKKAKKEEKKAKKASESSAQKPAEAEPSTSQEHQSEPVEASRVQPSTEVDEYTKPSKDKLLQIHLPGLTTKEEDDEAPSKSTSPSSSQDHSPLFDGPSPPPNNNKDPFEPASAATSIASAVPPSEKPTSSSKHAKLPSSSTDVFKARLAARIEALRKARKASGEDGRPAQTRQELIESRRVKQAQRKAHKKEIRRLAKEEADRKREEAIASARTSPGSFMSPLHHTSGTTAAGDDGSANHFAFGRIAFADGAQMSHDLSYVKDSSEAKKNKGPSDPKTALAKLEAQKKRLAGLDEDKRKEVLEKETWLAARRRAEGEGKRVRDDESLLKKAVKRKDAAKKKSEREWGERKAGVDKAMRERQKKREDNIRKRRDEKMAGKMGGKKKVKFGGGGAPKKSRAGFEGAGFGGGKRK